jgi:uncharacterized protein
MPAPPQYGWDGRSPPLILSLTGGGFRGYFTALVVARIEELLGAPCHKVFNLIAGTSIGGIIALGLSFGIPAARIAEIIGQYGEDIFPPYWLKGLRRLFGPPYSAYPISLALRELFGRAADRPIATAAQNVMVVTVSTGIGRMEVLASWDAARTAPVTMTDAALATSAAPTYFKAHRLQSGMSGFDLVDGGIAANAPDAVAIQRAVTELGWPEHRMAVFSVGTCATIEGEAVSLRPAGVGYVGALRKLGGRGVVNLLMAVQEDRGLNEAAARLGSERYLRVDKSPSEEQAPFLNLDNASERTHRILETLAQAAYQDILQGQTHNVWQLMLARAQAAKG